MVITFNTNLNNHNDDIGNAYVFNVVIENPPFNMSLNEVNHYLNLVSNQLNMHTGVIHPILQDDDRTFRNYIPIPIGTNNIDIENFNSVIYVDNTPLNFVNPNYPTVSRMILVVKINL